jgi:hypothetical protein
LLPSSLLHFFLKNTFRYLFPPEKNKNHWQKAQLTQNGEIQKPQRKRKKSFAPLLLGLLLFLFLSFNLLPLPVSMSAFFKFDSSSSSS